MKKLLILLLCLHPVLGLAGDYPCIYLKIRIKNETQSACYLVGFKMVSGNVLSANLNDIPLVIPVGQTSDSFMVAEGFSDKLDLDLTYECGENNTVKFDMQKGLCRYNAVVTGSVLSTTNLDAKFEASNGLYWDNKPASIVWTLSDLL